MLCSSLDVIKNNIQNLSEEELKICWKDIKNYSKDGIMGNTLVRMLRDKIVKELDDKNWDSDCRNVVIPEILYEIARRKYDV